MKLLTDEQKELYSLLFKEYKKAQLSQKEASKILGVSIATMYRWRENGVGVSYKKLDSKSKNGTIHYYITVNIPDVNRKVKLKVKREYEINEVYTDTLKLGSLNMIYKFK